MSIPKECKRLAEVDFPIAEVSKHAVREKSIRHGHPSTLHLWWARRPLASSRAMLMALLLPDPADPNCPPGFREQARAVLLAHRGRPTGWDVLLADDMGLRKVLLKFIGDFANWDYAADPNWLKTARDLVKTAYSKVTPLVVDPFAGGGSIPLEALRTGCDVFASDLNPVAVLINQVMLEDIPRYGRAKIKFTKNDGSEVEADGLAEALRIAGAEVKAAAEKELAQFYPADPDGTQPVAYLWARTVMCEAPNCGSEIPLVRSFWLAKKANRRYALRYVVERHPNEPPKLEFEVFVPKTERSVPSGTISRARVTCPCCNMVLSPERVRAQLTEQSGGGDVYFDNAGKRVGGARLLAVVTTNNGQSGRKYRIADSHDLEVVWRAQKQLQSIMESSSGALNLVPNEPLPLMSGTFNVPLYGMSTWGDLFTARQKLALITLCKHVQNDQPLLNKLLSIAIDRVADGSAAVTGWLASGEEIKHVFSRQALPMVWDFGESNYLSDVARSWNSALHAMQQVIEYVVEAQLSPGQVGQSDARQSFLPDSSADVWFTDPPYYFAVPYADLSDFFYVWLKRSLREQGAIYPTASPGSNDLTPKDPELCEMAHWDSVRYAHKDKSFFEKGMGEAFSEGNRVLKEDGIGSVVFAHKTTEGWEALLAGLIRGNWVITGSWPIATEAGNRLRAMDSAALATSVHLICRP